ncbi:hypothetical protein [Intestinicryptomonas porci]|uniref:Uncharacterized protein n=1 Tax=Intestinicryptomonas porci TaxID=2926320 RepID=A0ABU4WED5_9BACT|nr:hypothetical protein [Opitutales bacterium CLA-KB-P66]
MRRLSLKSTLFGVDPKTFVVELVSQVLVLLMGTKLRSPSKIVGAKKRELFNIVRVFSKWWAVQDSNL